MRGISLHVSFPSLVPLVSLVLAVTLTQIPLFNSLGYECSLAFGAVLPLALGLMWLGGRHTLREKLTAALVALAIPPVVMLLNMAFVKNCTYFEGLGFYLLAPVMGSFFSIALAELLLSVEFRFRKAAFLLIWLCSALGITAIEFYKLPNIFFFNQFFGYYAGAIYDEAIEIEERYLFFRLVTIILAASLWLLSRWKTWNRWVFLTMLFFLTLTLLLGRELRFNYIIVPTYDAIGETLAPIDSAGYWQMDKQASPEKKARVKRRLELELASLTAALGQTDVKPVRIFIYPDSDTKKKYTGADNTEFTKIWLRDIHIDEQSFDGTIRHELAHILFGDYGIENLGISNSIGLVEGIAVTNETPDETWTDDELAAALFKLNLAPKNPESLLGGFGFWTGLGATSYTLMGSFTAYLVGQYGLEKFKHVFAWSDFDTVYGKPAAELAEEWKTTLQKIAVPPELESAVRFRFQRKSIFQTECPHAVAVKLKKAAKAMTRKEFATALKFYEEVLQMTESQNPRAVQGYINAKCLSAAAKHESLSAILREADSLGKKIEKREPFLFAVANVMLWSNAAPRDTAIGLFQNVYDAHISFGYDYAAKLRQCFLKENLNVELLSPLRTASERDSLLMLEMVRRPDTTAQDVLRLIFAERLAADDRADTAITLLERTSSLPEKELTMRRHFLLLELLVEIGDNTRTAQVAKAARETADLFVSKKAKHNLIEHYLLLGTTDKARPIIDTRQ
jgi:hypothetical protein